MDEEEFEEATARRFQKADVFVVGFGLVTDVLRAVADTFELATNLAGYHANWKQQQAEFHEQAALAIESITNGEEEDG